MEQWELLIFFNNIIWAYLTSTVPHSSFQHFYGNFYHSLRFKEKNEWKDEKYDDFLSSDCGIQPINKMKSTTIFSIEWNGNWFVEIEIRYFRYKAHLMYCLVESMSIKFYVNPNSIEQRKNCLSNTTTTTKKNQKFVLSMKSITFTSITWFTIRVIKSTWKSNKWISCININSICCSSWL